MAASVLVQVQLQLCRSRDRNGTCSQPLWRLSRESCHLTQPQKALLPQLLPQLLLQLLPQLLHQLLLRLQCQPQQAAKQCRLFSLHCTSREKQPSCNQAQLHQHRMTHCLRHSCSHMSLQAHRHQSGLRYLRSRLQSRTDLQQQP